MPSEAVLRRKAQKKKKRRKIGHCELCGGKTFASLETVASGDYKHGVIVKKCWKCKRSYELAWTGVPG